MKRPTRLAIAPLAAVLTLSLAACGSSSADDAGSDSIDGDWTPVTIEHALGTTTIEEKPERVATVNWANEEVPLALGVVPVGMAKATFGDDNGDGVLPWTEERLKELDAETPVLFDETDGIDFEGVADTQPDVILAGYSGLTQKDYDTLSEIAPVVAYPEIAWGTPWRETILTNSEGIGMAEEGEELVADLEKEIEAATAEHPELADTSAMFLTHVDTTDLSEISFYTTHDTRVQFLDDLGMPQPGSISSLSEETEEFVQTRATENVDEFKDVDVIITYGEEDLIDAVKKDPVLSQVPAIKNDAIVTLPGDDPLGTAANPTPLAIPWILEDYLDALSEAADSTA